MKMKTRQVIRDLTAYTWGLQKKTIPASAILRDFRVGDGHEGPLPKNPEVASFHYDGQVHFNLANEILDDTRIIKKGRTEQLPFGFQRPAYSPTWLNRTSRATRPKAAQMADTCTG